MGEINKIQLQTTGEEYNLIPPDNSITEQKLDTELTNKVNSRLPYIIDATVRLRRYPDEERADNHWIEATVDLMVGNSEAWSNPAGDFTNWRQIIAFRRLNRRFHSKKYLKPNRVNSKPTHYKAVDHHIGSFTPYAVNTYGLNSIHYYKIVYTTNLRNEGYLWGWNSKKLTAKTDASSNKISFIQTPSFTLSIGFSSNSGYKYIDNVVMTRCAFNKTEFNGEEISYYRKI